MGGESHCGRNKPFSKEGVKPNCEPSITLPVALDIIPASEGHQTAHALDTTPVSAESCELLMEESFDPLVNPGREVQTLSKIGPLRFMGLLGLACPLR